MMIGLSFVVNCPFKTFLYEWHDWNILQIVFGCFQDGSACEYDEWRDVFRCSACFLGMDWELIGLNWGKHTTVYWSEVWRMPITAVVMKHPSSWQLCAGVTKHTRHYTHANNTNISLSLSLCWCIELLTVSRVTRLKPYCWKCHKNQLAVF